VHFSKGCYLGQEIVERVRARGQVHKGLASVTFEGAQVPAAGAEILAGGAKVGNVLSARFSPAEGVGVGFAMLSVDVLGGAKEMDLAGVRVSLRGR
jgi:aminomethyltransferase